MLNKIIKYALLTLGIWGFSACTGIPRIITIDENGVDTEPNPVTVAVTKRPEIKEEILLGEGAKNSNLGSRVAVPTNSPVLGTVISDVEEVQVANLENTERPVKPRRHEVMERIAFPTSEYRQIRKKGRSTVSGKIYLENAHTSFKIKGKKIKLWLNPVTSYSRQWYNESYLGGYKLSKTDKRLYNYLKFTYSDRSGNFDFFGVPAGNYYLTGTISCADECGFSKTKSIRLVKQISVGRGVTTVNLMKHVP